MKQAYRSVRYVFHMYRWYRRYRSMSRWNALRGAVADELNEIRLSSGKSAEQSK